MEEKIINKKVVNILTIALSILFVVYFIGICIIGDNKQAEYDRIYAEMLESVNKFNGSLNSGSVGGVTETAPKENPIFDNAKDAVLSAFDNYNSASCYEVFVEGTTNSSAAGQNVLMKTQIKSYHFSTGEYFQETLQLEKGSNFGQTKGRQSYYTNNTRYDREAKSVYETNDGLNANFSGSYEEANPNALKKPTIYEVSKSTITKQLNFEVVYNPISGRLTNYYASVELNPYLSTVDYAKSIADQGGSSLPDFKSVTLHIILDSQGNLISMRVEERFTLVKTIVINITADCKNVMNYTINLNKEPTIEKPNI